MVDYQVQDMIQTGLLITATLGVFLTFMKLRSSARVQQASFFKEMHLTFLQDREVRESFYLIEYNKYKYGCSAPGEEREQSVDRLLLVLETIVILRNRELITKEDYKSFEYYISRVCGNAEVQAYFAFLKEWASRGSHFSTPFANLMALADRGSL